MRVIARQNMAPRSPRWPCAESNSSSVRWPVATRDRPCARRYWKVRLPSQRDPTGSNQRPERTSPENLQLTPQTSAPIPTERGGQFFRYNALSRPRKSSWPSDPSLLALSQAQIIRQTERRLRLTITCTDRYDYARGSTLYWQQILIPPSPRG